MSGNIGAELQPGTSKEMTTKATKLILESVTFSVQESIDLRNKCFAYSFGYPVNMNFTEI